MRSLPTAAEARRQAIENLDSNAQKQFNTIAGQIKNAVAKGQVFLTINITYDVIENLRYEIQILKDCIAEHLRELQGCKDELRQKQRDLTLLRKKKI